jgi:hypothetical protein
MLDHEKVAGAAVEERLHEWVELLRAVLEVAQGGKGIKQVERQDGDAQDGGASIDWPGDGAPERLHDSRSSKRYAARFRDSYRVEGKRDGTLMENLIH